MSDALTPGEMAYIQESIGMPTEQMNQENQMSAPKVIKLAKFDDEFHVSSMTFPEFQIALSVSAKSKDKREERTVFLNRHEVNQLIASLQEAVKE